MCPRINKTVTLLVTLAATSVALAASPVAGTAQAACKYSNREAADLGKRQARQAVLCLVNARRRGHGVGSLDSNDRLQRAAQNHSEYMTSHRCFAHQCPGESSLLGRMQAVDYLVGSLRFWGYGENIAWGGGSGSTPRHVVAAWMGSAAHRANILKPQFDHFGVGFDHGSPVSPGKDSHATYTTDFGYRG